MSNSFVSVNEKRCFPSDGFLNRLLALSNSDCNAEKMYATCSSVYSYTPVPEQFPSKRIILMILFTRASATRRKRSALDSFIWCRLRSVYARSETRFLRRTWHCHPDTAALPFPFRISEQKLLSAESFEQTRCVGCCV